MKEQHDNPWARSRRLASGDKAAAALLFRLHYWMGKTTYTWGDHKWVAMLRRQWLVELACGLEEYKGALALLKALDMIVVERHEMPNDGRTCAWIRLSERGQRLFAEPYDKFPGQPTGGVPQKPTSGVLQQPSGWVPEEPILNKIPSVSIGRKNKGGKGVSSDQINLLAKSDSGFEKDSEENQQCETNEKNACVSAPENEEAMPKKFDSCYDVVDAKKSNMLLHNPNSAKALGNFWLDVFREVHGPTAYNLTLAQLNMLKQVIAACPPDSAPQIVEKVIREWDAFRDHCTAKAGGFKMGDQPTIEKLLKYVGFAVSFAASPNHPQEAPVFVTKKSEPLQSIAIWKKPSLANPDTASLEEVLAFNNEDTEAS